MKKINFKTVIRLVIGIIFIGNLNAQSYAYEWAYNLGSTTDDIGRKIKILSNGDAIVVGTFSGTTDFDNTSSVFNFNPLGANDMFIMRQNPNGDPVWVFQIGGTNAEVTPLALEIDASNNIYIGGAFRNGTVDFDPGAGTENFTSISSFEDGFLMCIGEYGGLNWAHHLAPIMSSSKSLINAIDITASGDVLAVGYFNIFADFDPTSSTSAFSSNVGSAFIWKFNSSGNYQSAAQFGGSMGNAVAIESDVNGNIIIGGTFQTQQPNTPSADFDPAPITGYTEGSINDSRDCFILTLDNSGNFSSVKTFGGSQDDILYDLTLDNNNNIVYVGGFQGTANFDLGFSNTSLTAVNSYGDSYIAKINSSGAFAWVDQISGPVAGTDVITHSDIETDNNGGIYSTGNFRGTIDFDPGSNVNNLTATNIMDAFVLKLNSSGNFLGTKTITGNISQGNSIAIDQNDIYVTGSFDNTADFNPDAGIMSTLTSNGGQDIFVLKLSETCDNYWVSPGSGSGVDNATSTATDNDGNVLTSGAFSGTVDFDPSSNVQNLTSAGNVDGFVVKHDVDGNLVWVRQIGGTDDDYITNVDVDNNGNVYGAGTFKGTADIDPSSGVTNATAAGSDFDLVIFKLDPNGNLLWTNRIGNSNEETAKGLVVNKTTGDVYLTGKFTGTVDFNPGTGTNTIAASGQDAFVLSLNTNGGYNWTSKFGGPGTDYGQDVTLNSLGEVLVTGYFQFTMDFDPNPNTSPVNIASYNNTLDMFIQKLSASTGFASNTGGWAPIRIKGISAEYSQAIVCDEYDNVYLTGNFFNDTYFNPADNTTHYHAVGTNQAQYDFFVEKFNAAGVYQWVKVFGGANSENGLGIDCADGNVYVTGSFSTNGLDFGDGNSHAAPSGNPQAYILKLSTSNGAFEWVKIIGGSLTEKGNAIDVNEFGIHIAGVYAGTVDFNTDPAVTNNLTSNGNTNDFFVYNFMECSLLQFRTGQFVEHQDESLSESIHFEANESIVIYPNPSEGNFTVSSGGQNIQSVSITDALGRSVKTIKNVKTSRAEISLENENKGFYFVEITYEGQAKPVYKKIIVE